MKIIHIIPSLKIGGAERLAIDICNEFNNIKSIEVILVVLSEVNDFINDSSGIQIKYIPSKISLSISGKTTVEIRKLTEFINDFSPDIIHTHLFEAELISRWTINPKPIYFTHCHDNMSQFSGWTSKKSVKKNVTDIYEKKIIVKKYLSCNNQFIAISKNTKQYFEKILPEKLQLNIHLLYNAIDYKKFHSNDYIKKTSVLRLINVGSFAPKKNQIFLIDVILELKTRGIKCELYLLGDGQEYEKVKEKAFLHGLNNEIHFLGNVNNVEEHLWKSHIYLHSAYYEPLGLVLLEAMAAGLPIVTLDGKGNRDLIEEGKNGFMLDEHDPEQFANKIIALFENKDKYTEVSNYCKEYAKQFDIKEYANKLLILYKESMSFKN